MPGRWRGPAVGDWTSSLDRAAYTAAVRRIREHIAAGEVYQANLCRVLSAPVPADADVDALTALLARGNPAPYAGTIRLPGHGVETATASPELFLRRDGRVVESGPIKGTGRTEADLLEKDYAENVMIVDLVRNDIGRVCATGSVTVPDLCAVEKHPGLVHLVSTVRGELRDGAGWPSCSAPPSRPGRSPAPQVQRPADHRGAGDGAPGPYCGGIGWVDADRGTGELAVGIRTFWIDRTAGAPCCVSAPGPASPGAPTRGGVAGDRTEGVAAARGSVGGVRGEWRGTTDVKIWLDGGLQDIEAARVSVFDHGLTVGDGIFETVKAVDGRPFALTRHLDRLTRSARGLGLPDPDLDEVRRACDAVLAANPVPLGRLRITYTGGHGPSAPTAAITARRWWSPSARPPPPDSTAVVTVPWTRNERGALTGLKTTSYAENVVALARARERGASEALFGNTVGQLCEGTGSNVFVVLDGEIHTRRSPPGASRASPAPSPWSGRGPRRPICRWTCWSGPTRSS